ncbi:MAG: DUF2330 domain-containing protein [Nannocystaceae bacterium]|nr:DUF2330 domain-containing protein [bacterium]
MNSTRRTRWLGAAAALSLLGALAGSLWQPAAAHACGIFAPKLAPEERPTLSREKVLIVHDAASGVEHFVREVVFDKAGDPFGFVVPTPSQPTVHAVETTPFTALRKAFPFRPQPRGKAARGLGKGAPPPSKGVQVLDVQRVGSFKAFVLAATDQSALATWLTDNGFDSPPEAQAWLEHYVQLGFYYVALRYEPPASDAAAGPVSMDAETLRITFDAPLPYYPYLEPRAPETPSEDPRLLEVWYVGAEPMVPVAVHTGDAGSAWVRPWRAGKRYPDARDRILGAAGTQLSGLLPEGSLQLQTFQDQKRRRDGFGDVVLVPETGGPLSPERREALATFVSVLDPSLPVAGEVER